MNTQTLHITFYDDEKGWVDDTLEVDETDVSLKVEPTRRDNPRNAIFVK